MLIPREELHPSHYIKCNLNSDNDKVAVDGTPIEEDLNWWFGHYKFKKKVDLLVENKGRPWIVHNWYELLVRLMKEEHWHKLQNKHNTESWDGKPRLEYYLNAVDLFVWSHLHTYMEKSWDNYKIRHKDNIQNHSKMIFTSESDFNNI